MNDKANDCFKSSFGDVNNSHSQDLLKRVNKLLMGKVDAGVSPLLNVNEFLFAEKVNANLIFEKFFTGNQLEKLSSNEEFKLPEENTLQQSLHSERPEIESDW